MDSWGHNLKMLIVWPRRNTSQLIAAVLLLHRAHLASACWFQVWLPESLVAGATGLCHAVDTDLVPTEQILFDAAIQSSLSDCGPNYPAPPPGIPP